MRYSQIIDAVAGSPVLGTEQLSELRAHLRGLLELLHWEHLDSWVDELLVEVRSPWCLQTLGLERRTPPSSST